MIPVNNFILAFILSFAGSIPPGSINLTVVQMGLENKVRIALRFSLAASIMEYPYAWIAVKFEKLITSSPVITENIQILSIVVLIILGLISVWPSKGGASPKYFAGLSQSGYRRGLLLGILNPLAIPYWIGITAYLQAQRWIDLTSPTRLHAYLAGVFAGALLLLLLLIYLSKKVMSGLIRFPWIRKIPGFLLLALGLYSLVDYLLR
jgi:threonine/homoserine/homoserine lactone efflux protein